MRRPPADVVLLIPIGLAIVLFTITISCAHPQHQPQHACLTTTPPELNSSFIGVEPGCPPNFAMCLTTEQFKDLIRQLAHTERWIANAWQKCGDGSEPPPLARSR